MTFSSFMGLNEPLNTIWADGRNVVVYPDGKVEDTTTGKVIRNSNTEIIKPQVQNLKSVNDNLYLVALVGIIIIGIIAVSKK